MYQQMAQRDAEFYSRLEAAGFELDFGVDGSGLFVKHLRRGSGYYIDVGWWAVPGPSGCPPRPS